MFTCLAPPLLAGLLFTGLDREKGFIGVKIRAHDDGGEIVIDDVVEKGPAEAAGLKKDDVILKVNGGEIKDLMAFVDKVRSTKPGNEITFLVKRDGKEKEIKVRVGKMPDQD